MLTHSALLARCRFPVIAALAALLLVAGGQSAAAQSGSTGTEPPEGSVGGMGDINLYPRRVVLQGRDRITTVGLYNRAAAEGNYEIELSDRIMLTSGELVDLADAGEGAARARLNSATEMLRWSPRRIALPPNESQTIRIMARIPPDLPAGEYRTHFSVMQVPPGADGGVSIEQASGQRKSGAIGVRIVPRFGISIPVIVRVGDTTLEVGLRDLAVKPIGDGRSAVTFTITRSGTRSAFGNITVTPAGSGKAIATVKGVGVYPEIDERFMTVPVDPEALTSAFARGARLTVTYTDDDFRPGEVLARQEFIVP